MLNERGTVYMGERASLIALYLPQFHEVEENNMWWGKGFTDWVSVQNASSFFRGHNQPRVPYKSEYYDLLDKRIMDRQVRMAHKAGIDGFCFYHYWFNGRKILEKPVENYLRWTDLKQKFCLSWDNASWIRTWSNIDGNDWNPIGDLINNSYDQSILIEQEYGNKQQWKQHFEYLLLFFQDKRYIKIDEKPIFIIHRPDIISCLGQMIRYWRSLARENGLKGLYIIVTNPKNNYERLADGVLQQEPAYTVNNAKLSKRIIEKKGPEVFKFDEIWRNILIRKKQGSLPVFMGALSGYDDTPRRGRKGYVIINSTPKKFAYYLRFLLKKSRSDKYGKYIFITAWNEWGEGAYLEPDEQNSYNFLKACRWALRNK